MLRTRHIITALAALVVLGCAAPSAKAENFSFAGTFTRDDDVRLFTFNVVAASVVTLRTLSYAGGTNAAGAVVPAGGFDPVVTLFGGAGQFLAENDDAGNFDAALSITLTPGRYVVGVTQFDNFAVRPNLSDGFQLQGFANFRDGFVDSNGNQRNGNFAIDILNVAQAEPVPEPATLLLLGTGLAGGVAAVRRKARRGEQQ